MTPLEKLRIQLSGCEDCGATDITFTKTKIRKEKERVKIPKGAIPLINSSRQPVPGSGSVRPKYAIVGEAPGVDEDLEGEGFVGYSGNYLRRRLLKMAKIREAECAFLNTVRCHPLENRDPYANEIKQCSRWLEAELALLQPEVILAVGKVATKYFLPDTTLKAGHGQVFEDGQGRTIIPLYHPAAVDRAIPRKTLERDYRDIRSKLQAHAELGEGANFERILITNHQDLEDLFNRLEDCTEFAFDIETNESDWSRQRPKKQRPDPLTNQLAGFSVSIQITDENEVGTGNFVTYYVPTCDYADNLVPLEGFKFKTWTRLRMAIGKELNELAKTRTVFMHNAKFEMMSLAKYGVTFQRPYCTMISSFIVGQETLGLKDNTKRRYGYQQVELGSLINLKKQTVDEGNLSQMWVYGCDDAYWCHRIGLDDREAIEETDQIKAYDIMINLLPWIVEQELEGINIDDDRRKELEPQFQEMLNTLKKDIFKLAGQEFNLDAPAQVSKILFGEDIFGDDYDGGLWGLTIDPPTRPTRNGPAVIMTPAAGSTQVTTNKDHLKPISYKHPIIEKIIEHGSISTIQSTFVTGMPAWLHEDTDRIHPSFNQVSTRTSRLSSSYPSIMNFPIRNELAKKMLRGMFFADQVGWVWWSIDQSQIELRWAAHLSQDEYMLEILRDSTKSFHKETCRSIYQIDEGDKGWDNLYKNSKNGNFAALFGAEKYKVAETLEIPVSEADNFLRTHYRVFPGLWEWIARQKKLVKRTGYAETAFGFRRYLPDIRSKNFSKRSEAERVAVNTPIQGSATQHMQLGMIDIAQLLKEGHIPWEDEPLESVMKFPVHDEVNGMSPRYELDFVVTKIKDILENVVEISVPTPVEIEVGSSWGEVEGYELWKEKNKDLALV